MMPLWIAAAGGAGAVSRFVADGLLRTVLGRAFPWATVIINVSGSFLLGFLTGIALRLPAGADAKLILGTGFCGGYTTFSTASFETVRLIEERRTRAAVLYVVMSLGLGLGFCALGLAAA